MRVVGIWSAIGLAIVGLIAADLIIHPNGTKQIANGIISLEKNTGNQLLGTPAK